MKILGIESASLVASAAIVEDGSLIAEYTLNHKKTHSQTLLPMIDEIARMAELDLQTLDAIAVSGGPGSFTGLRIGSATAKGLGLALDKPLIHIPTLDAMAYGLYHASGVICPILDAKRGQVYGGIYDCSKDFRVVKPQCAISLVDLVGELNTLGQEVIFLGDGVPVGIHTIEMEMRVPYTVAPVHLNRQRGAAVAALGMVYFREGRTETAAEHAPDYLRLSQAERELLEKQKKAVNEE